MTPMTPRHYYNEFEPYAADWLRNLILQGYLPAGEVDTRPIQEVSPEELCEFTSCHFFAGIGGWPLALRLAGWPDDRPVWTGSCPCQPFSTAGRQQGTADERHLWPVWFNLIRECRPAILFGEQVASAIGHGWLDLVYADLEGEGYACGAAVLPAASVGAPHKRDRLWFGGALPDAQREQHERRVPGHGAEPGAKGERAASELAGRCSVDAVADGRGGCGLDDAERGGQLEGHADGCGDQGVYAVADTEHLRCDTRLPGDSGAEACERGESRRVVVGCCGASGVADTTGVRRDERRGTASTAVQGNSALGTGEHPQPEHAGVISGRLEGLRSPSALHDAERAGLEGHAGHGDDERGPGRFDALTDGSVAAPGRANPWAGAVAVQCLDGKARLVEPSIQPLAHGVSGRVGRLRAYGNAIVPEVAAQFVIAFAAACGVDFCANGQYNRSHT